MSSVFAFTSGGTEALTFVRELHIRYAQSAHVSSSTPSSTLGRFLSDMRRFSAFMGLLSLACLHRCSLALFSSSLHTRMAATLRSLLNSCTGLRKASLLDGSSMWDVFSVWSVKPSGTVIEFGEWPSAMGLIHLSNLARRMIGERILNASLESSRQKIRIVRSMKEEGYVTQVHVTSTAVHRPITVNARSTRN